jgi:hypothetical protein
MSKNELIYLAIPSRPILSARTGKAKIYFCDRCGIRMEERQCKIACPNCGNRFDCSDLNLHFDELKPKL